MNIIQKLTIRHLIENKRRTLVTIIGVIISVAMVTAVATLSVSFLDLMKRQLIADEGEWHVEYQKINREQLEAIERDTETKKLILAKDLGYAKLNGSDNPNKPYVFIKQYNKAGLHNFPITLKEGRFPSAENEILISEEIAANAKVEYKIGDQLKLEIGDRFLPGGKESLAQFDPLQRSEGELAESLRVKQTKAFKVVGVMNRPIWEPSWSPGYTVINFVDKHQLQSQDKINAIVILKEINSSLYDHANSMVTEYQIPKVAFNNQLLRLYGVTNHDNLRNTLFSLVAIIMSVIIIGSVSLIYNAFAISVSERSKHLGMLSSVGATKKQKRNSVLFEGTVIGAISIPIGIVAGLAGIGVTFWFINSFIHGALGVTESFRLVVTPKTLVLSCIISMMTIFISAYIPARRASKISAIDAIRQTEDVKLSGKTVKTSKMVRKIFGFEAEIGLKNMKRNKRRYQATVFSLVISIVLFLTVSFFTANLKKSLELSQDGITYDIRVFGTNSANTEKLKALTNLKGITEANIVQDIHLNTWINQSMIANELKENLNTNPSMLKGGKYPYYLVLHGLDDESFQKYAKQVGADSDKLLNPKHATGIVIEEISYQDQNKGKYVKTNAINTDVGEWIDLYALNIDDGQEVLLNRVEIGALTNQLPMGEYRAGLGGIDMIVSETVLNTLITEQVRNDVRTNLYIKSASPMLTQEELEEKNLTDMDVYNVFLRKQQEEQMILFMSIFTYGFIALITLISVANIFNTISTSISLRKREFAMLKSVGMTPKGFNQMIQYESIFYGIKSLLYGLPLSFIIMYFIYWSLRHTFEYGFTLPWMSILFVIAAIFTIVGSTMLYSISKVKKDNIIDALKQKSI